ncbi:MAG: hypothetical protein ABIO49_00715 [Dokdonella sp.]
MLARLLRAKQRVMQGKKTGMTSGRNRDMPFFAIQLPTLEPQSGCQQACGPTCGAHRVENAQRLRGEPRRAQNVDRPLHVNVGVRHRQRMQVIA